MLHQLVLYTKNPVREKGEINNISKVRASIVQTCKSSNIFSEEEMRLIDFRPPPVGKYYPLPVVLYAHPMPGFNKVEVFSFCIDILEKMKNVIHKLDIHGKGKIDIKKSVILKDVPFLPRFSMSKIRYKTATPFIYHDHGRAIDRFFALQKKLSEKELIEQLKKDFPGMLKLSIKSQISNRLQKKMEDLSFIDSINIEVDELTFRWGKYHESKPPVPKIMAKFSSDWELPIFIGHQTGKGYGRLLKVQNSTE